MPVEPTRALDPDEPLTVVVATRDRPALLNDSLRSLRAACRPTDRVVVVDSASCDPAVSAVAREAGSGVDLIRCEEPGTCRARNAGWRAARTAVVAFTDDDCLARAGWAGALAAAMAGPACPDFVTGRVVADGSPSGRAQLALSLHESIDRRTFDRRSDPTQLGHGANMAWRRDTLARLGGFDDQLGPGAPLRAAEDHDLFWRALSIGATGGYEPLAVVGHRQWRTRRQQLLTARAYGVGSGAVAVKGLRMSRPTGVRDSAAGLGRWQLVRVGLRPLVWEHGLVVAGRSARAGYQMGALAELVKLTGAVEGAWRARQWGLSDGHFTAPRS